MNEPYAAIPLSWGLETSGYYRFLIWLACRMSGADGFNGLREGEVRFSRKDVELAFGITNSIATSYTRRAIKSEFLRPTGRHGTKLGNGEIYECLGQLRECRKLYSVPRMSQVPTKQVPSKKSNQTDLDDDTNQASPKKVPSANRLIDKNKKEQKRSTLSEILRIDDVDYSSMFWSFLSLFPKERKTFPRTIAACYRQAIIDGATASGILDVAKVDLSGRDPKYVPNAAKWLSEGAWMNHEPTQPEEPKPVYVPVPYVLPE